MGRNAITHFWDALGMILESTHACFNLTLFNIVIENLNSPLKEVNSTNRSSEFQMILEVCNGPHFYE